MNYGWGGSQNAWYTIDQLYCPWSGCGTWEEYAIVGIQPEPDSDNDGLYNSEDNCPATYNPGQEDEDDDGFGDVCDNCWETANTDQSDIDGDGVGDVCDTDIDDDQVENFEDNCPWVWNTDQADADGDTVGDVCDNCVDTPNPDQYDWNSDGVGDACDGDIHIQGYDVPDGYLGVHYSYEFWAIGGIEPYTWSMLGGDLPYGCTWSGGSEGSISGTPEYEATYYMTLAVEDSGDPPLADTLSVSITITDPPFLCGDTNGDGVINIADALYLIAYVMGAGQPPNPLSVGDCDCNATVNISDVVYLLNYVFAGGPAPCAAC
jgi:hypothetical protein